MNSRLLALALAAPISAAIPGLTAAADVTKAPWIHVQVDERKEGGAKVNVNLPLSAAEMALDLAKTEVIAGGRIRIDRHEVSVASLRRMWRELRGAGDADLVTVEDGGDRVRVSQKGGRVLVEVDEGKAQGARVRIDVPAAAVDALLAGEAETLDLRGALAELEKGARGEFISIQDGDTNVRVWID